MELNTNINNWWNNIANICICAINRVRNDANDYLNHRTGQTNKLRMNCPPTTQLFISSPGRRGELTVNASKGNAWFPSAQWLTLRQDHTRTFTACVHTTLCSLTLNFNTFTCFEFWQTWAWVTSMFVLCDLISCVFQWYQYQ